MYTNDRNNPLGNSTSMNTADWAGQRKKILIIDDEPDLRTLLGRRLQSNGFNVVTADCGRHGIEKANKENPDLIILDVAMPGMDGGEVASVLKENTKTKDTPVMFLSCLIPKGARSDGSTIGGNYYMSKPYNPETLLDKINEMIPE